MTLNTNITTESVETNIWSRTKNWYKKNTVEFSLIFFLTASFIYAFILLAIEKELLSVFNNIHWLHTNYTKKTLEWFGSGTAMMNATLVTIAMFVYGKLIKAKWTGASFMGIFMVYGYSYYVLNFYGIIGLGIGWWIHVYIFKSKIAATYTGLLLGTCLSPIYATIAYSTGMHIGAGMVCGVAVMIFLGMISQQLAAQAARLNDGFTLANTGVALGWPALMLAMIYGLAEFIPQQIKGDEIPTWVAEVSARIGTANDFHAVYLSLGVFTIMFGLTMLTHEKQNGLFDVLKHSGRAPTDYFAKSGVREAFFNVWLLSVLAVAIEIGLKLSTKEISGIGIGYNSNVTSGFYQVVAFAVFGKHFLGAIQITAGILLVYFLSPLSDNDFMGGSTINEGKNGFQVGSVSVNDILAVVYYGWLICPFIAYNWVAPFIGGMLHVVVWRFVGTWNMGLTLYSNGISTMFSLVIVSAIFNSLKLVRKIRTEESANKPAIKKEMYIERAKSMKIANELLFVLFHRGATNPQVKYEFHTDKKTDIIVSGDDRFRQQFVEIADQINSIKRNEANEWEYWRTLGMEGSSQNLQLLAEMVNKAEVLEKETFVYLKLKREVKKNK